MRRFADPAMWGRRNVDTAGERKLDAPTEIPSSVLILTEGSRGAHVGTHPAVPRGAER